MAGASITQIIPIHGSYNDVAQLHRADGDCQVVRFLFIQWLWAAMCYIAKGTTTGTDITHDHEGGGTVGKTFTKVGAGSLFAYGIQIVIAQ
jgi:hypothetical protein